ncbi:MAG: nucleotide-binding protein [Neisseriaceae bacterium]|nr:nucleotide-binding protein [Neisseriaceae bacterium]
MSDLDKLKKLIRQADELLAQEVTTSSPEFSAWHLSVKRFLEHKFGKDSTETKEFDKTYFSSPISFGNTSESEWIKDCARGITETKLILETYLEEMEESQNSLNENNDNRNIDLTKVFIVHGHNGEIKQKVARLLEQQNIQPIILDEQVNAGNTIIEKFEQNSNVGVAICLFTADDTGKANKDKNDKPKPRARQNVVLETGFFMGKLGRGRIVVIADNGIELPSDMQGVVYINNNWEFSMLKELKSMGFEIDLNKI